MNTVESSPGYGQIWFNRRKQRFALIHVAEAARVTYSYQKRYNLPEVPTDETFKKTVVMPAGYERRKFALGRRKFVRHFHFSHVWV